MNRIREDAVHGKIKIGIEYRFVLRVVHAPVLPQRLESRELLGDVEQRCLGWAEPSKPIRVDEVLKLSNGFPSFA
jgi:hypothetical protein